MIQKLVYTSFLVRTKQALDKEHNEEGIPPINLLMEVTFGLKVGSILHDVFISNGWLCGEFSEPKEGQIDIHKFIISFGNNQDHPLPLEKRSRTIKRFEGTLGELNYGLMVFELSELLE